MTDRISCLLLGMFLFAGAINAAPTTHASKRDAQTKQLVAEAQPVAEGKFPTEIFAMRPAGFLVDPQRLLGPKDFADRSEFLQAHAAESKVDLYLYILRGEQELSEKIRSGEWVKKAFATGRPAVVVLYIFSAPQKSVQFLTPVLDAAVPANEQRSALQSSAVKAAMKGKPVEQVEAFCAQMSISIYWMERLLLGNEVVKSAVAAPKPVAKSGKDKHGKMKALLADVQAIAEPFAKPAAMALAVLALGICLSYVLKCRKQYRFPELQIEPRLGATRGAGVGAVLSFASINRPPAAQREQRTKL